jgi:hypothetical protein
MMQTDTARITDIDERTASLYRQAILALQQADIPFLVGGAFALRHFAGIARNTKDFDIFVRPVDRDRALKALAAHGYRTEVTFDHWLGKARCDDDVIDVIYRSGNGISEVDEAWFEHAREVEIFGVRTKLCPPEETIWSKAFIQERERFDGADIAHILRVMAPTLDWRRLIDRFGAHWRVLSSHVVLFGFIYPSERDRIPAWVIEELSARLLDETSAVPPCERVCNGTLLSRRQYLSDIQDWGYVDGRLLPRGSMTDSDVERWTEAGLAEHGAP